MSTQTPKILSALLAQLPDNDTGDISAEDIRDAVTSLFPSRGAIELLDGAETTTFAATNVYKQVTATTVLDATVTSSDVLMPAAGQLKFTKAVNQIILLNATLSVLPSGNNKQYSFTFAKNGTPIESLHVTQFFGNLQGRPQGVFLSGIASCTTNDVFTVVVRAETDTTSIATSVMTLSGIAFIK